MVFHQPDTTFARLKGMWLRSKRFAKPGEIPASHPLAAAWSNCKLGLSSTDGQDVESIVYLDWFAERVEVYAQNHLLAGDDGFAAIAAQWLGRMMFDPTKMHHVSITASP